jgi:hypothetical protein
LFNAEIGALIFKLQRASAATLRDERTVTAFGRQVPALAQLYREFVIPDRVP